MIHRIRVALLAWLIMATLAGYASYAPIPAPGASLPACATEDSAGPCRWDASRQGNGQGRSFWVDQDQQVHYLDPLP
jgi:hypothetical protein